MGNNIAFEIRDGDFNYDEDSDENDGFRVLSFNAQGPLIPSAIRGHLVGQLPIHIPTEMPVIRKKPDIEILRHTSLYHEIKALCGLPANSKRPTQHWSLTHKLMKQENGFISNTANLQRRITNLFVPNNKEERLMSLESKVYISKFNKDGSKLITACQDSIVRIFDSSKGTYHLVNRMKAKDVNWSILDMDFSPCGKYFAYSTWSNYFFIVPVNGTAEELQWLDLNADTNRAGVFSIRFSPCCEQVIGGCNNSCIYIHNRETGPVRKIQTQSRRVDINAVSYVSDTDSNVFVSGCNNGIIKLWDARCLVNSRSKNNCVGTFIGHHDGITYIDPRNDGHYILSNSKDQSIKIWDLRKMTPQKQVSIHRNLPLHDWDYRWDMVPREYYNPIQQLEGDTSVMTYRGHRVTKSLLRAKFSPKRQTGQRYIYTGCGTGRIIIYDVLTGHIKEAIEGHKDIVRDLDWHPVRSEIISSSWDSHVNLNTFKRNLFLKRPSDEPPLRRSRRIALAKQSRRESQEQRQLHYPQLLQTMRIPSMRDNRQDSSEDDEE